MARFSSSLLLSVEFGKNSGLLSGAGISTLPERELSRDCVPSPPDSRPSRGLQSEHGQVTLSRPLDALALCAPRDQSGCPNSPQIPSVEIISQAEAPQQRPALVPRADLLPLLLQTLFPSDLPLRDKLFLTIKEAARFAGLPQATIRRLIHAAAIPAVKAGGWRIKRSDLEQLDSRQLSVLAYNLGNLWRRLGLPPRIKSWSLTSLQQRLMKTGGRLVKHARYYWLLLAEGHLNQRLFGDMLHRISALPLPSG